MFLKLFLSFLSTCALGVWGDPISAPRPNPIVVVLPNTFATLGSNGPFRGPNQLFNPTNTTPPFIQVFDKSISSILPQNPFVVQVTKNNTSPIAADAPVYNPNTNEIFFASSLDTGNSLTGNNRISKINVTLIENAVKSGQNLENINVPIQTMNIPNSVINTNGGTGPYNGSLLLGTRGRGKLPSSLVLVNPKAPFNTTVLVDNFFGRQFNSINDIKVHNSGKIFFTDPSFGYINQQKPAPQLPNQVYSIDPVTRLVRVVADQLQLPNGIAFSTDGKIAFVSDTGLLGGAQYNTNTTGTATIYAYDVNPQTQAFENRRVFAYIDAGIPDGLQIDTNDNVYAATADGVQIFNKNGILLGKIFLGTKVANIAIAGKNNNNSNLLVILAGNSVFVASIKARSNVIVS